ncbi:hypothetical protein TcBrA4_0069420 [Trypanosoma cruzi]|nr:hypothetical protein TcBrA4_0069420 [Trypanosoma cruzi]
MLLNVLGDHAHYNVSENKKNDSCRTYLIKRVGKPRNHVDHLGPSIAIIGRATEECLVGAAHQTVPDYVPAICTPPPVVVSDDGAIQVIGQSSASLTESSPIFLQ